MKTAWFLLFFVASPVGDNPNGPAIAKRNHWDSKALCEQAIANDKLVTFAKDTPDSEFSIGAVCVEGLLK